MAAALINRALIEGGVVIKDRDEEASRSISLDSSSTMLPQQAPFNRKVFFDCLLNSRCGVPLGKCSDGLRTAIAFIVAVQP